MENDFVTIRQSKAYKTPRKRASFTHQKVPFYYAKGHLLECKRASSIYGMKNFRTTAVILSISYRLILSAERPCPALHWYVKSPFKKEVPDRQMTVGDFFLYNLFKGTYTITAPFLLLLQNINQTDFQRYHSTPPCYQALQHAPVEG